MSYDLIGPLAVVLQGWAIELSSGRCQLPKEMTARLCWTPSRRHRPSRLRWTMYWIHCWVWRLHQSTVHYVGPSRSRPFTTNKFIINNNKNCSSSSSRININSRCAATATTTNQTAKFQSSWRRAVSATCDPPPTPARLRRLIIRKTFKQAVITMKKKAN